MHPAFSVIFFTTASGAGYGLLFLLGVLAVTGQLPSHNAAFAWGSMLLSLGLISAGLLSSTFHLGHPERAWRAVTQWKSSWLAREGVAALFTYVPAAVFAWGWLFEQRTDGPYAVAAGLAAAGAVVTVFCTGSIYNSLKTIHQWHNAWTMPNYLLLGLYTGSLLLGAVAVLTGLETGRGFSLYLLGVLLLAWAAKAVYWHFIATTHHPATIESATGLKHLGKVSVLEPPHSSENYLLKEMGFQIARKHADKLRKISTLSLFVTPLLLVVASLYAPMPVSGMALVLAALFAALGVVVERWLFFAEARHVVTLYYGASEV